MGNCCADCLSPNSSNNGFKSLSSPYLLEKVQKRSGTPKNRNIFWRLFSKRNKPQKMGSPGLMEGLLKSQMSYQRLETQRFSTPQSSYQKKDIQLQCLDARALLGRGSLSTRASTPENSLDLEWEHETLPCSLVHEPSASSWTTSTFPEDTLVTRNASPYHTGAVTDSECSRVSSSANSLEWDSVQNSIRSEDVDTDTQYLLNEIDRLTMLALRETGHVTDNVEYLDDAF